MNRRDFLQSATVAAMAATKIGRAAAPAVKPVRLGVIGAGSRGQEDMRQFLRVPGVSVQAVCDIVQARREHARQRCNEVYAERLHQSNYDGVTAYNDFREVLARPDIDAVLVAVPYHWASRIAMAAMRAGKDVYCEKPMAVTMQEATALLATAKRYGRIYQAGTQQRSEYAGRFRLACELIRNERIGQLKEVFAYCPPGAMFPSNWVTENSLPVPEGVDWDMWLGPLPYRPFAGIPGQTVGGLFVGDVNWGPHHYDIIQWTVNPDVTAPIKAEYDNGNIHYHYSNGVVVHSTSSRREQASEGGE